MLSGGSWMKKSTQPTSSIAPDSGGSSSSNGGGTVPVSAVRANVSSLRNVMSTP